jgi:hypothetical protein
MVVVRYSDGVQHIVQLHLLPDAWLEERRKPRVTELQQRLDNLSEPCDIVSSTVMSIPLSFSIIVTLIAATMSFFSRLVIRRA